MDFRIILEIMPSFGLLPFGLFLIDYPILLGQHLPRLLVLLLHLISLNPVRIDSMAYLVHLSYSYHISLYFTITIISNKL